MCLLGLGATNRLEVSALIGVSGERGSTTVGSDGLASSLRMCSSLCT